MASVVCLPVRAGPKDGMRLCWSTTVSSSRSFDMVGLGLTGHRYWNWALFTKDLPGSPIFDGSATSLSGNGEAIAGKGPITLTLGAFDPVVLAAGTGGGCVTSGPFKDMQVNLGPVALPLNNGTVLTGTGLEFNPRCLKRDLSTDIVAKFSDATQIMNLIRQNTDITNFQLTMQGVPGSGSIGVQ